MLNPRFRPHAAAAFALLALFCASSSEAGWSANGTAICPNISAQGQPTIVSDGAGGAIIAWIDGRTGGPDVFAQRITGDAGPLWLSSGIPVCTAAGNQAQPTAMSDRAGGAVVTWIDQRASTPGLYAQRMGAVGGPMWASNGIRLGQGTVYDIGLISDGSNGLVVPFGYIAGWVGPDPSDIGDVNVFAQHFNNDGTLFWGTNGIALASSSEQKSGLVLASDGGGGLTLTRGAVLAWTQEVESDGSTNIIARRIGHDGALQWGAAGVGVCTAAGSQYSPQIVAVGSNQTIITWEDRRGTNANIYAQKLDGNGGAQWTANGLPVCAAAGDQAIPQILSDNAGGAWIVWLDMRAIPNRVFGQRLNGLGQNVWELNGVPLCTTGPAVSDLRLMPDNAGGVIVLWRDRRNGNDDLFAQRVDANGNLLWASEGVAVTTAAATQMDPGIVTDGANGMIVAWQDHRPGAPDSDIYANRVFAGGGVVDVAAGVPAAFDLAMASANPTRGGARLQLALPEAANLTVDVLDMAGRRVRSLAARRFNAGRHALDWDGGNGSGARVGPGVYFVRAQAGAHSMTSRVVVLH
jgi:hypothetical protein